MSPALTDSLFTALTLTVAGGLVWGLRRTGVAPARPVLLVGAWLIFTAGLAFSGVLRQWAAVPPRLALVVLPPLALVVWGVRSRQVGAWLDGLPAWALVAPQVFRVGVEVLLWVLYQQGRLPVQMTFEGRNWDVLVGLTALPVAAWLARRAGATARVVAVGWHLGGLALLANIVVVAFLSTPSPLRQFWNEPANTLIADWPYVWLPGVLVPAAYVLHVLGLRQVARRSRN